MNGLTESKETAVLMENLDQFKRRKSCSKI